MTFKPYCVCDYCEFQYNKGKKDERKDNNNKVKLVCKYMISNHSNEYEDLDFINKLFNTNFKMKELMKE